VNDDRLSKIRDVESKIEAAMWQATTDDDHERELEVYQNAERDLKSLEDLTPDLEQERYRVLAYCLMRLDETLVVMGEEEGALERAKESLRIAELSSDAVQIARSSLAVGIRLLNTGQLPDAEKQWSRVFKLAEGMDEDKDMQQVVGWTLIVRANVLLGKSLYNQALELAHRGNSVLRDLNNYAGLAAAKAVLSRIHAALGDTEISERCKVLAEEYQEKAKQHRQ
jgi:tetratricopeptide (TPR) repeat protein